MLSLLHKAQSNSYSEKEATRIRKAISELELKFSSLGSRKGSCDSEQFKIAGALHHLRGMLSPLKLLPPEILAEIFEYLIFAESEASHRNSVLTLCGVSRHWRAVALTTPSLWTTVWIQLRPGWKPTLDAIYISRSDPLPLNIFINYTRYYPPALEAAISLIGHHISRTRNLHLNLLHPWCYHNQPALVLPRLKHSVAPVLSGVDIHLPQKAIAWEWISSMFLNAPRLHHLSFTGSFVPPMPWSQLRDLCLGSTGLCDSLTILSHAIQLRSLDLTISSSPAPLPSTSVVANSLSSLVLHQEGDSNNGTLFFAHVELSKLGRLILFSAGSTWRQEVFMGFLYRSGCILKLLSFTEVSITDDEAIAILADDCTKHLKSLRIEQCKGVVTNRFLARLTRTTPCLIMNMRNLRLNPVESTDGVLAVMIESRISSLGLLDGGGLLRGRFSLDGLTKRHPHPVDERRLGALRAKYLNFDISWNFG